MAHFFQLISAFGFERKRVKEQLSTETGDVTRKSLLEPHSKDAQQSITDWTGLVELALNIRTKKNN